MAPTILLLVLYLAFVPYNSVCLEEERGKVHVTCSNDRNCRVEFSVGDDWHQVELVQEEKSLFHPKAKVKTFSGEERLVSDRTTFGQRFHTKENAALWGTALISHDRRHLLDGIFATEKHGIFEWKKAEKVNEAGETHLRTRSLTEFHDTVLMPPGGTPWMSPEYALKTNLRQTQDIPYGTVIPFYPGCYPSDAITHVLSLNLIFASGQFQSLTSGVTGDNSYLESYVLSNLESVWAVGKLLYLQQLNVRLELNDVVFSQPTDPLPFSMSQQEGTCMNALGALPLLLDWVAVNNPLTPTGFWILLSDCFTGIDGVSYIGNLCGYTDNGGVAAYSWLVLFHELGHGFGSTHSFEDGIGTTGGIMDYGNGLYNGVPQFHPLKRADVCPFLTYMVSQGSCPFFTEAAANTVCGDGILEATEECECLTLGSTNCGQCVSCKLTSASIECSAADFVMRNPTTPDLLVVQSSDLSSSSCCINNQLVPPKTLCDDGLNACGAYGACVSICTTYLLTNNANCGFDTTGCLMGCVWENSCLFDLTYNTPSGSPGLISELPTGSSCYIGGNTQSLGQCQNGACVAQLSTSSPAISPTLSPGIYSGLFESASPSSSFTNVPTTKPVLSPTNPPIKGVPVLSPTNTPIKVEPVLSPTNAPIKSKRVLSPTNTPIKVVSSSECSSAKEKKNCTQKTGCSWCNRRCNTAAYCVDG